MSPLSRVQVHLRRLIIALSVAFAAAVGFIAGNVATPDPVTTTDLVPSGVNNCLTAIRGSLALLDPDSIVAFDQAERSELRELPDRCREKDVLTILERDYPHLLARLQTIGTDGVTVTPADPRYPDDDQ